MAGCGRSPSPAAEISAGFNPIWGSISSTSPRRRAPISASYFNIELPDPGDAADLEISTRFYIEDNSDIHLHSNFLLDRDEDSRSVPVAFVLHSGILFSVRNEELPVFRLQRRRARTQQDYVSDCRDLLIDLYGADVEYSADALKDTYTSSGKVGHQVLSETISDQEAAAILADIAEGEDLNGRIRGNILDTHRALSFLIWSKTLLPNQIEDVKTDFAKRRFPEQPHLVPVRQDQLPDGRHGRLHQHQPEPAPSISADGVRRGLHADQHPRRHRRHVGILDDDAGHSLAAGLWPVHGRPRPGRLCYLCRPQGSLSGAGRGASPGKCRPDGDNLPERRNSYAWTLAAPLGGRSDWISSRVRCSACSAGERLVVATGVEPDQDLVQFVQKTTGVFEELNQQRSEHRCRDQSASVRQCAGTPLSPAFKVFMKALLNG